MKYKGQFNILKSLRANENGFENALSKTRRGDFKVVVVANFHDIEVARIKRPHSLRGRFPSLPLLSSHRTQKRSAKNGYVDNKEQIEPRPYFSKETDDTFNAEIPAELVSIKLISSYDYAPSQDSLLDVDQYNVDTTDDINQDEICKKYSSSEDIDDIKCSLGQAKDIQSECHVMEDSKCCSFFLVEESPDESTMETFAYPDERDAEFEEENSANSSEHRDRRNRKARFSDSVVSDVRERPRTTDEEKVYLYYSLVELETFYIERQEERELQIWEEKVCLGTCSAIDRCLEGDLTDDGYQ